MKITIKHDLKDLTRKMSAVQRKQLPFAASRALNETVFDKSKGARQAEVEALEKYIDRPTRFTKQGFHVERSHKRQWPRLQATIEIPENRWKYMKYHVQGGVEPGVHSVPVNVALNRYGAIGNVRKHANKRGAFVRTINGVSGIWQRVGGKKSRQLKLLVRFHKTAKYHKRYPFGDAAKRAVRRYFRPFFEREFAKAMRTAR